MLREMECLKPLAEFLYNWRSNWKICS